MFCRLEYIEFQKQTKPRPLKTSSSRMFMNQALFNKTDVFRSLYTHYRVFQYTVLESDEPGGNRNRNIKINAQHNVRKRAI